MDKLSISIVDGILVEVLQFWPQNVFLSLTNYTQFKRLQNGIKSQAQLYAPSIDSTKVN